MLEGQNARTEVVPEVIFLGRLVERVASGKIRVPRFHLPFVWKQEDLHQLLDSVLRGFPIGSVLVWETEATVETMERVGPVEVVPRPPGLVGYLLDGHQRASTLFGTLRLPEDVNPILDQIDWRVYCDLESREFVRQRSEEINPRYFPVRSLLDTAGYFAACRHIESEAGSVEKVKRWIGEADRLANAFRDYQLPVIYIREADLDSAVTVFARLNRTGRKMTADAMVSALTYREGEFHLSKEIDEFREELERDNFGGLDRVLLLRAVLAALDRDIYAKDWATLVVQQEVRDRLPEAFQFATTGIKRAVGFLKELGVTSDRLLPYGLQIVLLGEFFRLCPDPDSNNLGKLVRWFWVTSFTGWFGGVNTAQANRALGEMRDLAKGSGNDFHIVDLDTPAQPFPERFDGRSARVRALMLYLASLRPRAIRGPGELVPGRLLSHRGTRAVGYVSSSSGQLSDLASSPANRIFVDENLIGQAFSELRKLNDEVLGALLPSHGFAPGSIDYLRSDDREGLIRARLSNLIAGEREFMKKWRVELPVTKTAANIADSDASDED